MKTHNTNTVTYSHSVSLTTTVTRSIVVHIVARTKWHICVSHNYIYSREQIVIACNFLLVKQLRLQKGLQRQRQRQQQQQMKTKKKKLFKKKLTKQKKNELKFKTIERQQQLKATRQSKSNSLRQQRTAHMT